VSEKDNDDLFKDFENSKKYTKPSKVIWNPELTPEEIEERIKCARQNGFKYPRH